MRYFFEIAFNGNPYHGWQIQENAITVQQVIQEKLQLIHKMKNRLSQDVVELMQGYMQNSFSFMWIFRP